MTASNWWFSIGVPTALYVLGLGYAVCRVFGPPHGRFPIIGRVAWGWCGFLIVGGTWVTIDVARRDADAVVLASAAMYLSMIGVVWGVLGALLHSVISIVRGQIPLRR